MTCRIGPFFWFTRMSTLEGWMGWRGWDGMGWDDMR